MAHGKSLCQGTGLNLIVQQLEAFAVVRYHDRSSKEAQANTLKTVLANVPVIQGLHTHAWGHISSFKFGEEGCPPPKFSLQRDSSIVEDPLDSIVSTRGRIRHSVSTSTLKSLCLVRHKGC